MTKFPHFTDGETETQGGNMNLPKVKHQAEIRPEFRNPISFHHAAWSRGLCSTASELGSKKRKVKKVFLFFIKCVRTKCLKSARKHIFLKDNGIWKSCQLLFKIQHRRERRNGVSKCGSPLR